MNQHLNNWLNTEANDETITLVKPRRDRPKKAAPRYFTSPEQADAALARKDWPFTFNAKKHERVWIEESLLKFVEDNVITDILCKVKGGKEATVYCCVAHPSTGQKWLAAKIYRPRMFRELRNDKIYREGRKILDADGKQLKDHVADRAIHRGSSYGKDLLHVSWLQHEAHALRALHGAGVSVPRLFESGANVMVMEYVGEGANPAPPLSSISLEEKEAQGLFNALMTDVWRMLKLGMVHGDLSAYNVLYWQGRAVIIDFPQVVDVARNTRAKDIFVRDVERLCDYFAMYGVEADPGALAEEMWQRVMDEE